MIGRTLSHYRIIEKIGAGGMGEVYRAHDEHLDRDVAIKVLPKGTLADEKAQKRFRKEALALSKLSHPNIATVHDFDTQEGVDFLVMEYVEGTTLAEKLKTGALPEREVVLLGVQIAEALEEAHERGVIHRDLKPGNIAVTPKGRVKVLDFGLARLVGVWPVSDEATTAAMTEELAVAGTLSYMAPEELRGERADHRSDLYSFGVVLYEMATGRRPFEEKLSTALTAAIVQKVPEPPSTHNLQVSPVLDGIIIKALEKDPDLRHPSARDMRVDLERVSAATPQAAPTRKKVSGGRWLLAIAGLAVIFAVLVAVNMGGLRDWLTGESGPGSIESLAVLPLENLSGDPEQDYFADGMTEALIANLAKIGSLKVISRTSAMRYKGTDKSLPEIARELNVNGIVEGSVLRSGSRVRITAQLIEASTDQHLWAETYEREIQDVLTLQSEVAQAIAKEVQASVTPEEQKRLGNVQRIVPEAHEAYLKGRYYWNQRTSESLKRGLEYYRQAIEIDPSFAAAYAGIAGSYGALLSYGVVTSEVVPQAKAAALKALEIDGDCVEADAWLAMAKGQWDWDWSGAEKEHERILKLYPSYASNHQWYAVLLMALGRSDEAIARHEQAMRLDPLSPIINSGFDLTLYLAGRYAEASDRARETLDLFPGSWLGYFVTGITCEQQSKTEEAIGALEQANAANEGSPWVLGALGHTLAVVGNKEQAVNKLDELLEQSRQGRQTAYEIALIYQGLGETEKTFEWLEKAYQERPFWLLFVRSDPRFKSIFSNPRFQDLLRRMNLPE